MAKANLHDFTIPSSDVMQYPWLAQYSKFYSSTINFFGSTEEVYQYRNVFIDGKTGAVFDSTGELCIHCLNEVVYWLPATFPSAALKDARLRQNELAKRVGQLEQRVKLLLRNSNCRAAVLPGSSVYLYHPFGWYAYGHIHDSLQRFYALHKSRINLDEIQSYLIADPRRIIDFEDHFSALSGNQPFSKVRIIDSESLYFCPELIFPISPAWYTTYTIESYNWLIRCYLEHFSKRQMHLDDAPRKRLYLSRNHIRPGTRSVTNEDELLKILLKHGFEVLYGSEPLKEVFFQFSSAELIIAPHGSLLANTIFCRSDCKVVEFCPSTRINTSFLHKLKAVRSYAHVIKDADNNHNITINPDDIMDYI